MATKDIKRELLEMLRDIDHICTKENISYMLSYGTLLGAVRQKGFIEWDDDVDLMMLRKDFEAFEQCSQKYFPELGLFLGNMSIGKTNHWEYVSIIPYVGREDNPDRMIEIMILDTIPAVKYKRKCQVAMLFVLQVLFRKNIDFKAYKRFNRKMLMYIIAILGRWTSEQARLKAYKNISTLGNRDSSDYLFISTERPQFLNLQIEKSIVSDTVRMPFAGLDLLVPAGWDSYLRLFYGDDYMTPKRTNYYVSV